jgi:hypothetical protein
MVEYLNGLLYTRGLGSDGCHFPIYLRDGVDGCFAVGYLNKVESFLYESSKRLTDRDAITETIKYIRKLKESTVKKEGVPA